VTNFPYFSDADRLYHHPQFVVTRGAVDCQAKVLLPYTTILVILVLFHSWESLMQPAADLLTLGAYLLMILGLVGAILPILPGPPLIWLGALLWAWADGFRAVGWPTLAGLGVLMVLAWTSDLVLTTLGTRKAGASWKAVAGAILGGIAGAILLSGVIPVIGTILGTILGALVGVLLIEYYDKRNWGQAYQASKAYILGSLAGRALEVFLSLLMIAIFVWQAFF
jgi:uncharacterized protein YqgC (DUF456 family)